MVDIISKKDGPRREDVAAKRLIDQNRPIIEGLANQLSGGNYSAMRQPPKPPQMNGFVLHDLGARKTDQTEHRPYVRVSVNDRVVLVDGATSKQLQYFGEIRDGPTGRQFCLATNENKFFSPLHDELSQKLADMDHRVIDADFSEDDLAAEIGERLGLE